MSTSTVLTYVFGGSAAVALVFFPFAAVSAIRFVRNSATTTGTVTRMEDVPTEGWIAHVDYEVNGAHHTLEAGSNGGYRIGEPVEVRYRRDDPSRAHLASGGVYMEMLTALILAVVFAGAAALFYVLGRAGVM